MTELRSSADGPTHGSAPLVAGASFADYEERALIEASYPLTALQEAMLFESILSASRDLYIVQHLIEMSGETDLEAFQRSWDFVLERHPALRTVFDWQSQGAPIQVVVKGLSVPIEVVDLDGAADPDLFIASAMEHDRQRGFLPSTAPLMRLTLFRIGDDDHRLLWSQHHLIQDAWSAAVVLDEVFRIHDALQAGHEPDLEPARPFSEYVEWLEHVSDDAEQRFWRKYVGDLENPTRMIPPSVGPSDSAAFTREFHSLTQELTSAARRVAGSQRVTLNSLIVAALAATIRHRTRDRDVTFAVVAAGRPPTLPGVERMVGLFINTLPMRLEVEDGMTASDLMKRAQGTQAELFEYEHTPLSSIQSWSRLSPGVTITDTLFAYGGMPSAEPKREGVRYRTVDGFGRTGFPLSVTVEATDPLVLGLQFETGSIPQEFARSFFEDYEAVISAMVANPEARVVDLLPEQRTSDTADFTGRGVLVGVGSVVEGFVGRVGVDGSGVALVDLGVGVSYEGLDGWSDGLAARFVEATGGGRPRVGLVMGRSGALVASVLGVLKAGGCYVPVDVSYPAERVRFLLDDGGVDLVATTPDLAGEMAGVADACGVGLVVVDPEPLERPAGGFAVVDVSGDDLAYIMYTSGSTGTPKGVAVTHRGLTNYLEWARDLYAGDDPISLPLYSSFGFDLTVTSLFLPLLTGGRIVVYPQASHQHDLSILDVFEDDQVDAVKLTPSHLALLQPDHLQTERIRTLIVGGEDLTTALAHHVHTVSGGNLTIYNEYGPTEATVACMAHTYDPETDTASSVPLGTPAHNTQILLLDQHDQPVPPHIPGEICVTGPNLAAGYHNNPEQTAEKFTPHPTRPNQTIYHTGDLATWTTPDTITYHSRTDNQLKIRGHRIEPTEIENTLTQHPNITQAVIDIAVSRVHDQRLVAYYTTDGTSPSRTELRHHLRRTLPVWMAPQHLIHVEKIPLTQNGKIDKAALPAVEGGVSSTQPHIPPRTEAERLVSNLCGELLGILEFGMQDNFFDLGGHSLMAMRFVATLESRTGRRISPTDVLLNTLEQVAGLLPGAESEPDATSGAIESSDTLGTGAFFFGPVERPLFGIQHPPSGETIRDTVVLICPPVGREYMRSHWALRILSRALVKSGFHVMRFDYSSTGDSWGDPEDMTVEQWVDDVGSAASELLSSSRSTSLALVGMRLGGMLATLACRGGLDASRLVLWDAVLDGVEHLADLSSLQRTMLATRRRASVDADALADEFLGFSYPEGLRSGLKNTRIDGRDWPDVETVLIDATPGRHFLGSHPRVHHEVVHDSADWDDYAALQAALLPRSIPAVIAERLRDLP